MFLASKLYQAILPSRLVNKPCINIIVYAHGLKFLEDLLETVLAMQAWRMILTRNCRWGLKGN